MKKLLTGDEAIARGAYEAGVRHASAYPGTPSTEILENIAKYDEIYAEWAPNEKVAMESAIGASMAGVRSMASMKHVGVNVAADPLMTFAYMGVNGGAVIVTADEPGMFSSQNEQDNISEKSRSIEFKCEKRDQRGNNATTACEKCQESEYGDQDECDCIHSLRYCANCCEISLADLMKGFFKFSF